MKFLSKLFEKNKTRSKQVTVMNTSTPPKPETKQTESVYLTSRVTFGMRRDEDCSVCFVDENRGIRKVIVDSFGIIQNFPRIVKEDFWVKEVTPNFLKEQVRFRSEFEKRENGWIFQ